MNRLIAPNTVTLANADWPPTTGTPGYATEGNPTTDVPATIWTAGQYNVIQEEIIAVIEAAALTPTSADRTQLLQAIRRLVGVPKTVCYDSPGVVTWTVPAGVYLIEVQITGGGGGAGCTPAGGNYNGGGCGGAGGTARVRFAVTPGATVSAVVGLGGVGGASANGAGGDGGSSTFTVGATTITAGGGAGAAWSDATTSAGGAGGTSSGGDINDIGGDGCDGQRGAFVMAGVGGGSAWGGGGRAGSGGGHAGTAAGSGGGGCYGTAGSGGNGQHGRVVIRYGGTP